MYFTKKTGVFLLIASILIGLTYFQPVNPAYASPLSASIDILNPLLKAGESSRVTITFSEQVTGFSKESITVPHGTLSEVTSDDGGMTWTATLTPADGISASNNVLTLDFRDIADLAGIKGIGTVDSSNYVVDTRRPAFASPISISNPSLNIGGSSTVTFYFTEEITGFTVDDITVSNGTLSEVTSSDGGMTWTATLTPAAGVSALYNVLTVHYSGVKNLAGNTGIGSAESTNYKVDTIRPSLASSIEISDVSLANGKASTVTFQFMEAIVGFTVDDITVPNGTLSSLSSSNGGMTWTATLMPDENVINPYNVLTLNYSGITDLAGNAGTGFVNSDNYEVDTIRPELAGPITLSDTNLKLGDTSTVTFQFTEAVTGFTVDDITVPNGTLSGLSSSDGIIWTATLTPNAHVNKPNNVLTLNYAGLADRAGNVGSGTAQSGNYEIYTTRPTAEIVVSDTSLTVGETSLVTITFSEMVTGFTNGDLAVMNGSLGTLTTADGGKTWTVTLTPNAHVEEMTNVITLDNSGVINSAGNAGTGRTDSNSYAVDTIRPTAEIVVPDTLITSGETPTVTITFSEAVKGFTNGNLAIPNGTLSEVTSSDGGKTWTALLTPDADTEEMTNVITLGNSDVTDVMGNAGTGTTTSNNYGVHTILPTAEIIVTDTSLTVGKTSLVTITFSEVVEGFTNDDLTVENGTLSPVTSSDGGKIWTAVLTPQGNVSSKVNFIKLQNQGVTNIAGNKGEGITQSNAYSVLTVTPAGGGATESSSPPAAASPPAASPASSVTSTNGNLTLPTGRAGTVSLRDEILISVPAGASLQELRLSVEKLSDLQGLLTKQEILASPVFEVLKNFPENFSKPIKLTLTFNRSILKADQTAAVFYYDEIKKIWVKVEGGKIEGDQITVEVDHLTKYAVLVVDINTEASVDDSPRDVLVRDISMHWAEGSIKQALSKGLVSGYPDGTFKPNASVTRAEFLLMLMNVINGDETVADPSFTDADEIGDWAKGAVSKALQAGIINGYADGSFRPNANITRAEMGVMVAKALDLPHAGNDYALFADHKEIPAWAKDSVTALKSLGILKGTSANKFNPAASTTRAEAVVVLMNMLEQLKKKS
ncbi:Ig-like domain-containing protein [Paenibacillus vini]|uniref:SLH domain-containing protein n=1 Tax=Paenibacillus vini TaxID=1476024 RepID=A0ABQ4M4W4_9BACL|nr:Ig-like domain-containing protein [Paenibacillus vini]GIP51046.1 hypothetical protein J42TS3_00810 [Paenibacillus vini]